MRRSIFKAGVWTAFGLSVAFAIVSANSNTRRAVTTAPAAKATVANAASTAEVCTPSDVCCAKETKVDPAVVAAAPRASKDAKTVAAAPGIPAFSSGAVIALDPETGELGMPSAQQMSELQGMPSVIPGDLNDSDVGLVDVRHASGAVIRDLQGRFQETSTVTIGPDGKIMFGCGMHNGTATSPTQAAPSALEEK
jgi:hypothetical protein